jgi:hypothetical protein
MVNYWRTPADMNLTQAEIDQICERLWKKQTTHDCPDCGVKAGKDHNENCDVARCTHCGGQYISCGCNKGYPDNWAGVWPGFKECYDQKLICLAKGSTEWIFDLNSYYLNR